MNTTWWVLAGCLIAVAAVVAWPAGTNRRRLVPARTRPRMQVSPLVALGQRRLAEQPRPTIVAGASALGALGWLAGGVVAGVVAAVYGALTLRAVVRKAARGRAVVQRARSLDDLAALAADLRAGLPPAALAISDEQFLSGQAGGGATGDRLAELTRSVWRLAERTGAPAAELVERIEADARAADRAQASAAAQNAGAQATALLLAALPVGGIALGFGIGVNPLQMLLHTTLGSLCAIGAVFLQTAGLLWADRLTTGPTR